VRQLAALLSFWQNGLASYHLREGKCGRKSGLQNRRALPRQFAPRYRGASSAQKRVLLDVFAQDIRYHRGSGMWLLNHTEDVLHAPVYAHPSHDGSEVQHALFLAWNVAKCMIPFLPNLIDSLEQHGHLQLTEEIRSQLLSMSFATADRFCVPSENWCCAASPRRAREHSFATGRLPLCCQLRSLQRLQVIQDQRWKQETLPDGLIRVRAQFVPSGTILEELQRVSRRRFCLIDEVPVVAVGDLHL
jgi:hypothetical protein